MSALNQVGNSGFAGVQEDLNIPARFSLGNATGQIDFIKKGQFNKISLRPQVVNEQNSFDAQVQGVVNSSTIIGQSFRASQDNINGITLTLEPATTGSSVEDFESYADSAALQAVWTQVGGTGVLAELETVIFSPNFSSTKSMKLKLDKTASDWRRSIGSTDMTNSFITLDWFQDEDFSKAQGIFYVRDGMNLAFMNIPSGERNEWETFTWNVIDFNPLTNNPGQIDFAAITEIGFRVKLERPDTFGYADNIRISTMPGSVDIKLWDFGASPPVASSDSIDNGTQYTTLGDLGIPPATIRSEINLQVNSGKTLYFINDFIAGVAQELTGNNALTPNNYFLITINYVDTDVNVYGTDTGQSKDFYVNGFAFSAPDEATSITALGANNDIQFNIFSTLDVLVTRSLLTTRNDETLLIDPGERSMLSMYVEDINIKITQYIVKHERFESILLFQSNFRAAELLKGGKFTIALEDDPLDDVFSLSATMGYLYIPPTVNG